MVQRSALVRLNDILDAIDGLRDLIGGIDFEIYESNWQIRRAAERGIEIISEAARHIPDTMKAEAPDVPWPQIAAIGNKLRHEYQRVDDRVLWNVLQDHLGPLEEAIRRLRAGF